jgi:circadian clock protein KaiB
MKVLQDRAHRHVEPPLVDGDPDDVIFLLYVAGASDLSVRAISNVTALCDTYLRGHFQLEVIDVHRAVVLTRSHNVLVTPTLVKESPPPERRVVGDLSDSERFLAMLNADGRADPDGGRS